jgi:ribonuclease Z
MSLKVVFLGTSGSVPTLKRSLPSIVVESDKEMWMFDCGEGTQRQMMQAKVGFHKTMKIFISHLHGDHVLGLPGVLQTMALLDRQRPLQIYGPKGTLKLLVGIQEGLQFGLTFPVEVNDIISEGLLVEEKKYTVEVIKADHTTESLSYALIENPRPGKFYPKKATALGVPEGEMYSKLQQGETITLKDDRIVQPKDVMGKQRPGRKIVYSGDTKPYDGFIEFAKNADLLIHDCTFDDSLLEKAVEDGHSTPTQAALQALGANTKQLVLTHISARYPDASLLLEQAKKHFANTLLAQDFLTLELPLPK